MKKTVYMWVGSNFKYNSLNLQAKLLSDSLSKMGVDVVNIRPGKINFLKRLVNIKGLSSTIFWHYGGFDLTLVPFIFSHKIIFIYHNITPARFFWRNQPLVALRSLLGRLQLRCISRERIWIAVSEFNFAELKSLGFKNVYLCPCIVDSPSFKNENKCNKTKYISLLYTGRISPNKNCVELLNQTALAAEILSLPIELTIVGDVKRGCRYGDAFQRKLDDLRSHPWLTINWRRDGVRKQELELLYSRAWLYVSMSLHEGFGLPVCEAIRHGTPALFVECGGTESAVKGHGMVPEFDKLRYHWHLCKLIKSDISRDNLLRLQLDEAMNFSKPRVDETVFEVYSPLLPNCEP